MYVINIVTLILLIIGGLNWLLLGLLQVNAISVAFEGQQALERAVYMLIGLAAVWQFIPLFRSIGRSETYGERDQGR